MKITKETLRRIIKEELEAFINEEEEGGQDPEETEWKEPTTKDLDKMVADYMASRSLEQIAKDIEAAGKSQPKPTKRSTRYDGPAPLTMTGDDDFKAWKKKNPWPSE